ncbi:macro domain-containing protein [Gimesia sp.]|uniref:macro domain-containing protein n=1 Tax=Gimesia sp. TaxID=2024833 RepID=UPI003A8CDB45
MTRITYLKGDATQPQSKGNRIIAHVCNDLGGWGKGFVLAISKRWPEPEAEYRLWHRQRAKNSFGLGEIQLINVEKYIWVANMIGQRGMKTGSKGPPVRYPAIEQGLKSVAEQARELSASVHMPRIGCGLAGGKWDKIEPLIKQTLCTAEIEVYVYDFDT